MPEATLTEAQALDMMRQASDLARYYTAHCWIENRNRLDAYGLGDTYTLAVHLTDYEITSVERINDSWDGGGAIDGTCHECLAQTQLNDDMEPLTDTYRYECDTHEYHA